MKSGHRSSPPNTERYIPLSWRSTTKHRMECELASTETIACGVTRGPSDIATLGVLVCLAERNWPRSMQEGLVLHVGFCCGVCFCASHLIRLAPPPIRRRIECRFRRLG